MENNEENVKRSLNKFEPLKKKLTTSTENNPILEFTKDNPRIKDILENYTSDISNLSDEDIDKILNEIKYPPFKDDQVKIPISFSEIEAFKKLNAPKINKDDIPSGINYGKCGGIKNDMNKPQLSLVPMQMLIDAAYARMYGNNKYKDVPGYSSNNWCTIDKQRVIDAFLRHIVRYLNDEDGVDEESGLPHLCHVAANLAFLCEMQQPNWEEKKNRIIDKDPILSKAKKENEKEDK